MSSIHLWIRRARNAPDDHRLIARGMALVALFVFIGKVAGAAKEMTVAWRYGVSDQVDAYLFVFNLVMWPVALWLSVLMVVLLPFAARVRRDASLELPRFRSELFGLTLLLGAMLSLLALLGLPPLLRSSWAGLRPETIQSATAMAPILILTIPLGLVVGLFSAWMLAAGRHANTLLEGVPATVLLIALVAFRGGQTQPLVWGTVVGFALHLLSLAVPLSRSGQIDYPKFTRQSPLWRAFWQSLGITVIGQALMSVVVVADQFFAAHLGTGAIATLSYANRILGLILGLGATAVTRSTLPVFSEAEVESRTKLRSIATHWVRILFVVGVLAACAGWFFAPIGVKLLFQRGAFTANDSDAVTKILRYGLAQLPFYFAGLVMVSMVVSQRRYAVIAIIGGVNLLTKVAANFLLTPYFGVSGLMISTSAMLAGSCGLLSLAVFRTRSDRIILVDDAETIAAIPPGDIRH